MTTRHLGRSTGTRSATKVAWELRNAVAQMSDTQREQAATTRHALSGWTAEWLATQPAVGAPGLRAFHASEIPFVFDASLLAARAGTPPQQRLSRAMQGYWAAVIRDGPRAKGRRRGGPLRRRPDLHGFRGRTRLHAGPPNGYDLNEALVCRRRVSALRRDFDSADVL